MFGRTRRKTCLNNFRAERSGGIVGSMGKGSSGCIGGGIDGEATGCVSRRWLH